MRHLALLIGIGAASLVLGTVPAAQAANNNNEHFTFTDSFTDVDFCGTGQAVDVAISAHGTAFLAPKQPDIDFATNIRVALTFTNPDTGATVIGHTANRFTDGTISGDRAGIHIEEATNSGLVAQFRLSNGGILIMNAGVITVTSLYDGDEFLSGEITVNNGPHPTFEDDELFCEVATVALGL